MPIWAWIYIGFVCFSGVFGYKINQKRGAYYLPGEILSVLSILFLFSIGYGIFSIPNQTLISVLVLVYVIYWEAWENRHNYNFSAMTTEVSDAFREEAEPEEDLDKETALMIGKAFTYFAYFLVLFFLSPVLYVFFKIVW